MLEKTITYTDYNGNERTETHYFNLNKNEAIELSLDLPDNIGTDSNEDSKIVGEKIFNALGKRGVYNFTKNIILKAYGVRTDDGRGFKKSKQLQEEFENTLAFDEIFVELIRNPESLQTFMVGLNSSVFK